MKAIQNFIGKIWRYWYFTLAGIFIILFFPFLYILSLRDKWFGAFSFLGKLWARVIVHGMGFGIRITKEAPIPKGQYIVCPNHTSYLDIPLLLSVIRFPVKFIGKAELGNIPVFGSLYRRTAVLVDRASVSSRKEALNQARLAVQEGHSMCIYPEGKIPRDKSIVLDSFKNGAFNIAIQQQIPIIPITFVNVKRLYPARSTKGHPGLLKVIIHKPIPTKGLSMEQLPDLKEQVRNIILKTLETNGSNK